MLAMCADVLGLLFTQHYNALFVVIFVYELFVLMLC